MYCPECRAEYREGFARCKDCDVDLVAKLPPEPVAEAVDVVAVFEGNLNAAEVALTTLEGAGIEAWIKDEEAQGVFPSVEPVEVLVRVEDEEAALEVLDTVTGDVEALDGEGAEPEAPADQT